jgi:hypothetical protein
MEAMEQDAGYSASDLQRIGAKWLEEIRLAEKREDDWAKDAERAESIFLSGCTDGANKDEAEFNILHSNVETIVPSIYNSAGKPDIRPRHNNADGLAKLVADVYERAILTMIDDNRMDAEVEQNAQDVFVAGRGIVRVKFDADVSEQPVMMVDPLTGQPMPAMDPMGLPVMQQVVTNERVMYEVVSWRDFRMGPASRWNEVPWVAFRHCIPEETLEKMGDAALMELQPDPETATESDHDVHVWEIWCKDTGRVYFVVGENGKVLSINDDPLRLKGFFPCAQPVQPITATGKMTPVCPYRIYRTLAEELDLITARIRGLTEVMKAKGAFAGAAQDLENLAAAEDGEIIPLADMENIMAQGGLERAIMWWPIDRIIQVIRELSVQREQTKQAIYEITGISDIIRGQGAASETATAQQIKTQWGSLRIKKMQRMIERQVRELFVLTTEIIAQHFSPQTLQKLSGMQIPQEAMAMLQQPLDHYRIDVESDSTVRADLARGREEMAQFLQGTAQFFQTMAPVVAQAPQAAGPIVEMYASFARQFNLGKQAEDALDQFAEMAKQAAANPPPNPQAEAMQAEMQQRAQSEERKFALEMRKLGFDAQKSELDVQLKQRELGLKEKIAEVDAAARLVEIEMEDDQQRAVAIGPN